MSTRKADGWVYGPEKDYEKRTHPNLVDNYEDLPEAERRKDVLFAAIVRALTTAAAPEVAKELKKKGKGDKPAPD